MTVTVGMILVGSILIYGGVKNLSLWGLARGDNTQAKRPHTALQTKAA